MSRKQINDIHYYYGTVFYTTVHMQRNLLLSLKVILILKN